MKKGGKGLIDVPSLRVVDARIALVPKGHFADLDVSHAKPA